MTKSKAFFYFCLSFIFGIFLDSIIVVPGPLGLVFLIFGIILILFFWKRKKAVVVGFCLIFLFLGIWRHQFVEERIKSSKLVMYNNLEEDFVLIGTVVKEPDIREKNAGLIIKPEKVNNKKFKENGRVLAVINRYPEYQYGDKLKIVGKLKAPPVFNDFNYKNYLKKQGIYSVIYYPKTKLLERGSHKGVHSLIYAEILQFKNKLRESIYQNFPYSQGLILGAMILGDKNRIPQYLKEKLNIAGIRHIIAVSGMHIVVLSNILMPLLLGIGLWRGQAFYASIIFIFLFIVMTGAQPSGIRAGIMGGIFLLGQKIGRKSVSQRTILTAAALMLAVNPLFLLNDAGFQLSFLAAMGIIYLAPVLKNWLRFVFCCFFKNKNESNERAGVLIEIMAMTFSAQIFTLPLLIYNFGKISLVAPLTNILIIPVVCWIMIFGFIFALAGIVSPFLGWLLSFPCLFLLTYLLKVVDFFSKSWAVKSFGDVHWFWLVVFYLILGIFTWHLNKKEKLKFLNY